MKTETSAAATRAAWGAALSDYMAKRAASDATPEDDSLTDTYCQAMDRLIEGTRAPDEEALRLKVDLIEERYEGFTVPSKVLDGLVADALHFAAQVPA